MSDSDNYKKLLRAVKGYLGAECTCGTHHRGPCLQAIAEAKLRLVFVKLTKEK